MSSPSYNKIAAALITAGFASGVLAQNSGFGPAATPKNMSADDAKFVNEAGKAGSAEIQMGKVAQHKSGNASVKQFAARMIDEHGKAGEELKKIANNKSMGVPSRLDADVQKHFDALARQSGASFDKQYMDMMVSDHRKAVALFRSESQSGKDADLKSFAAKTLPTLEDHLKQAQSTQASLK